MASAPRAARDVPAFILYDTADEGMTELPESAKPALDMLKSVGGDDMVAMLMRTFLQFADERVAKLAEESGQGRWEEVASIAHAIKSSARQLGANALSDACAVTEEAGRAGDGIQAAAGVTAIQVEFAAAREWMQELASKASS
ncbi:MAG: Hpt domain-containing protein [Gemmatimonadetes bacterium]|nr:Hpt domain-containing protein [Gemmatimonadota bacterium]